MEHQLGGNSRLGDLEDLELLFFQERSRSPWPFQDANSVATFDQSFRHFECVFGPLGGLVGFGDNMREVFAVHPSICCRHEASIVQHQTDEDDMLF